MGYLFHFWGGVGVEHIFLKFCDKYLYGTVVLGGEFEQRAA